MFDKFRSARRGYNLIRGARQFVCKFARQENRCLGKAKIRRPFLGFIYAAHQRSVFLSREVGVESGAKVRIHVTITRRLDQKLSFPHYLLAIEPDIKITADTVDMRFGSPICAGVLGIGMTKSDMDSRKLFVL